MWQQEGEIQSRTIAKSSKTQTHGKKAQKLTFTAGLIKWWWLVVMIGDENGDDSVSVSIFTKANANPNPGKTDHLVASHNS
jgi:hypothetical protein